MLALEHGWHEAAADLLLILSIVIAATAVFKFPYRRFTTWVRGRESEHEYERRVLHETVPDLIKQHEITREQLELILSELRPNHGSSLRDVVNRIEEGMEYNKAMFRGLLSTDPRAMFITDQNADVVWVNNSYTELTNRDSREVVGQGYWGIINPDQLPEVRKQQSAARQDRRDFTVFFDVATGRDDEPFIPVRAYAIPIITGPHGELSGYLGFLQPLEKENQ